MVHHTVRGTYGTPEAGTRTAYAPAALCLRSLRCAEGGYAWPVRAGPRACVSAQSSTDSHALARASLSPVFCSTATSAAASSLPFIAGTTTSWDHPTRQAEHDRRDLAVAKIEGLTPAADALPVPWIAACLSCSTLRLVLAPRPTRLAVANIKGCFAVVLFSGRNRLINVGPAKGWAANVRPSATAPD